MLEDAFALVERDRERKCQGKRRFKTKQEVYTYIKSVEGESHYNGAPLMPYKCKYCRHLHAGTDMSGEWRF